MVDYVMFLIDDTGTECIWL